MAYKGMPSIEKRYAQAFADITVAHAMTEEAIVQLNDVVRGIDASQEMQQVLFDAEMPVAVKINIVDIFFKEYISEELYQFLILLVQRNRLNLIHGIRNTFIEMANKNRKVIYARIFSPFPLAPKQIFKIKEMMKKQYDAIEVRTRYIQDKSIVGGVRIQVGDRIYDYSVKGMLDDILYSILED